MRHLSNTDRKTVLLEVGGVVNKPRLHVLIYPGKPLVCLFLSGNGKVAIFVVFNLSTKIIKTLYGVVHYVVKKPFITVVSLTELHVLVLKCEAFAKY